MDQSQRAQVTMRTLTVTVPWQEGLHLLPASRLVRLSQRFRCTIRMQVGAKVAEATSILSILILCATLNTSIAIEVAGTDEKEASAAVEKFFLSQDSAS